MQTALDLPDTLFDPADAPLPTCPLCREARIVDRFASRQEVYVITFRCVATRNDGRRCRGRMRVEGRER